MLAGPMAETDCSRVLRQKHSQPLLPGTALFPSRRKVHTQDNMAALPLDISEGRKSEQGGAANPYPRHAPCWFRCASLARITPRAGVADLGRSRQI